MPSCDSLTLRRTSGFGAAESGSSVIILQRGSRSINEMTSLGPRRSSRPSSSFSQNPVATPTQGKAAPANLHPHLEAEVWGVLYLTTRRDLVRLESTEGVPGAGTTMSR